MVVTAQKREHSQQDVPISVAAISGEKINDKGIVNLEELALNIPKVNISKGAASPNLFGKNLTDEETRVWNNDVATSASNSYFGIPERPRSFAIQARYRF